MNRQNWIVLPHRNDVKRLTADESYAKLLGLKHELDKERGHTLNDKQVNALQAVIEGLIEARACVSYYEDE